jgi:branched-chain amino acid transport system ATP-binding protein
MLEVRGLCAGYGEVQVLHGVDLSVRAGEVVALLGANGAGKTTLNNNLSGVFRPFAGQVVFEGQDLARASTADIVAAGLIHVPEGRRIFGNLSVRENLVMGSYRRGKPDRARNLDRVWDIFPKLLQRAAQKASTLSGGEQQMLAIGRGLMSEPRLLILDEPSLGLSPLMVEEMFRLVVRLNAEGLSVLLVEQNVVQSMEVASRAFVMEQGRIVVEGLARDLLEDPRLKASYLGL